MRRMPSWIPAYAVVAAVFAILFAVGSLRDDKPPGARPADIDTLHDTVSGAGSTAEDAADSSAVWSHGRDGATRNGDEHWQKHGHDFPRYRNAGEYERGAADFVHHPPAGTLEKHRRNGDTEFYDPQTNTFAVENRHGEPKTFFHPDHGRAYWERQ